MLLLYRKACWIFWNNWQIYIPLCFYFIQTRSTALQWLISIYIPLCFYFITKASRRRSGGKWFTFHYASTLSRIPCTLSQFRCLFTFHYASTLSLYKRSVRREFRIYIPLCFYFIARKARGRWLGSSFTFHYASTLSEFWTHSWSIKDIFTVHYASTLSILSNVSRKPLIKFTFHYASTLSGVGRDWSRSYG